MEDWHWYVYIIQCKDDSYYTGMSWCAADRWEQHLSGLGSKYTAKHGVKKLVHLEIYNDLDEARYREKQIKSWTRAKKEKLINKEWKQF